MYSASIVIASNNHANSSIFTQYTSCFVTAIPPLVWPCDSSLNKRYQSKIHHHHRISASTLACNHPSHRNHESPLLIALLFISFLPFHLSPQAHTKHAENDSGQSGCSATSIVRRRSSPSIIRSSIPSAALKADILPTVAQEGRSDTTSLLSETRTRSSTHAMEEGPLRCPLRGRLLRPLADLHERRP